ncbi:hypothetical protein L6452_32699 [Arctium lappa]|uniref:Uncharacterized protein n=1 Tax=Arctium lappa TaxID=4217 RepID=A0ACB8Z6J1_ARCLA|nr:hypothetical protein L6452_32699 [Arctium lappa]
MCYGWCTQRTAQLILGHATPSQPMYLVKHSGNQDLRSENTPKQLLCALTNGQVSAIGRVASVLPLVVILVSSFD